MYIPTSVMLHGKFKNNSNRNSTNRIFGDKVVSKKSSPLLYNIESGIQTTKEVVGGINPQARSTPGGKSNRQQSARELLTTLNVGRANLPKDFSLLSSTADNTTSENKNILTLNEFEKMFNGPITAIDKFPSNTDPFYKLDEGNISNFNYEKETIDGMRVSDVDMSMVAAGIVALNGLDKYYGKSKYFMRANY